MAKIGSYCSQSSFPQCPWATSTAATAEYFVQTCCLALGALGVCVGTMALRCTVDFKHLGKRSFQFAGEPERNNVKVKRPEGRQPERCKWKTPLYTEQRVLHLFLMRPPFSIAPHGVVAPNEKMIFVAIL